MRSSPSTLQNHYLKKTWIFMQDEKTEPEPKQQEIIKKNQFEYINQI
jgi:hypothetical protein